MCYQALLSNRFTTCYFHFKLEAENPEVEACEPEDPCIEDPTAEGCGPEPGLVGPTLPPMPPYEGCLLDSSLPECTPPPGGDCPPGSLMNEDGQCYPNKPCPPGYERVDDDESGACHPIPEENIYIDIIIVTEINEQVKQISTIPTTCTPQESTIALGPGSIAPKGVLVLAAFDPCILNGGGAILNLPDSDNNLKLLAVDLEAGSTHKAVEVNLQKINTIAIDQTFYNADFTRSMTGMSPITNKVDTLQGINSLVLLNDSPGQIQFVSDNSMAFNAILSPN
jgi:exosporium-targeted protein